MASRTVAVPHGTTSRYTNQCCRCEACREAWNAYCRDRRTWLRNSGELVDGWRDQLREMRGNDD